MVNRSHPKRGAYVQTVIQTEGEPIYVQVARELRRRITAGEWPPGFEIPSEPNLATEFGVGRDPTIRAAIGLLRIEGLVDTRRGYRARVRVPREREQVHVPAGAQVTARMPSYDERRDLDIPEGVPLLELDLGKRVYPADRVTLIFGSPPNPPDE